MANGVRGAISRTAEEVYKQLELEESDGRDLLPYIFEQLTSIDTEKAAPRVLRDTRCRETMAQLTPKGGNPEVTKRVVARLADAKLVITKQNPDTNETEVEVAHEALIRHWSRLKCWLNDARDSAQLRK